MLPKMDIRAAAYFHEAKFIINILHLTKRFVYAIPFSFVQMERLIEIELISKQIIEKLSNCIISISVM